MAAYRRPKVTDEEKAARTSAIQAALRQATVVPLETLRACAAAMPLAAQVAEAGNRSAASDAGVAVGLLEAAAAGAEANVRINLEGLKDEGFNAERIVRSVAPGGRAGGGRSARARQALAGPVADRERRTPGISRVLAFGLNADVTRVDARQQRHCGFVA